MNTDQILYLVCTCALQIRCCLVMVRICVDRITSVVVQSVHIQFVDVHRTPWICSVPFNAWCNLLTCVNITCNGELCFLLLHVVVFDIIFIPSQPVDLPLPTSTEIVELNSIISRVWVTELNADEKELIWRFRQVQRDVCSYVHQAAFIWNLLLDHPLHWLCVGSPHTLHHTWHYHDKSLVSCFPYCRPSVGM